ncbi:MAG: nuclear transport factor 2 family protein [Proteobacteria bacterium]|nr:nuclear transport factor 2 family protein [Pseudomonadota bacterium]
METPTLAEVAAQVQRLADIEEIKKLKYRYFRCFDMADLEAIAALFHPQVTLDVNGGIYRFRLEGREKFLDMVRDGAHAEMIMQHNGHHPEIDLISPTEARGVWYLQDSVWEFRRKLHITGAALYRDRYLKVGGTWLIKDVHFERIHEIVEPVVTPPNVTYAYLAQHARKLPPGELADYQKD